MLEALGQAIGTLGDWSILGALLLGTIIGAAAALLPGFGGVTAMAILLPLTFTMDVPQAMVFLVGMMAAGGFAGAVTSILLNLPGEGVNAATIMDGYPMARDGRAGVALGAASAASGLGAVFGLLVLGLSLPVIRNLLLFFGPAELFAFTMAGIALIAVVSQGSPLRGLVAGGLGLIIGAVGLNVVVGGARFTFGVTRLLDGIPLVPAIVGLFALPELYLLMRENRSISLTGRVMTGGVWKGVVEVLRRPSLLLRSSLIGTGVGILPGVGGSVASWIAYFAALNTSKDPDSFGRGNVEGVIAPEAANDAKEGGSMMPLLALGIPGSLSTAILLSAFLIHGVNPGQRMFEQDLDLIWLMVLGMVVANIVTSIIGLSIANTLVKLTLIPVSVLAPFVLALAVLGPYLSQRSVYAIGVTLCFGVVGLLMKKLDYPRPPLLVGLVLFPIAETNFHTAYQINRGSFSFLTDPVVLGILLVTVAGVLLPTIRRAWKARRSERNAREAAESSLRMAASGDVHASAGSDEGSAPGGGIAVGKPEGGVGQGAPSRRGSIRELAFLAVLSIVLIVFFVDSFQYRPLARLFPVIVLIATATASIAQTIVTGRRLRTLPSDGARGEAPGTAAEKGPLEVLAWIAGIFVVYWVLGMVVGTAVYVVVFHLLFDRQDLSRGRVVTAVVSGLAAWVFTSYVIEDVMGVRLIEGWLV